MPSSRSPRARALDSGNNFNWNFVIPIVASWTLDTNNNGRIDRIRVQVRAGTQLSDNFGGFVAAVTATPSPATMPWARNTDVFDILLAEGAQEDTGGHPTWHVLSMRHGVTCTASWAASRGSRPEQVLHRGKRRTAGDHLHHRGGGIHKGVRSLLGAWFTPTTGSALPTTGPGRARSSGTAMEASIVSMAPVEKSERAPMRPSSRWPTR